MKTRCNIFEEINLEKLPLWEDLPELELYLDQVLYYVNKVSQTCVDRDAKGITSSMVNNYVKHGHLEKPFKKKYQRHQVARLIAIAFLKNVFSLQEIGETLSILKQNYSSEDLYNLFVTCMNEEAEVPEVIAYSCLAVKSYYKARLLTIELGGKNSESNL
ncbi:DUF1836 domain-containing protein [Streptococcus thoraltensis]|uniref:DUF1836 domain-containing protein n=1 Tax=Streptococcus thoraltensis TaxID=55085 RepID=UPI0003750F16|nr:DUF1836 domain-containing protein [Streptococcus thoraltensis]MDY4761983.1 DUF1836 domain-containing protein [Streptococcus thoraltensis]